MGIVSFNQPICDCNGDGLPLQAGKVTSTAVCFGVEMYRGIQITPETLAEISQFDAAFLSSLRAQTGVQAKVSKLPPLIPTYSVKLAVTAFKSDLPQVEVGYKVSTVLHFAACNAPTALSKGVLFTTNVLLPSECLQRGAFVSSQQMQQDEVDRVVKLCGDSPIHKTGVTETQVWGIPWSEQQFIEQMVRFGHPDLTVKPT